MNDAATSASLTARYSPVAVYYEDADTVEYIRQDVPCVHRRVDDFLTLALDMNNRQPIGFRLKGFKNFYIHHLRAADNDRERFLKLVSVIETATKLLGNRIFDDDRRAAYEQARRIAAEDNASLHELPDVA
ncbi:MAG: hypothetical protein ACLPKB_27775 [Xanthobacteraceae bacterium]